MTTDGPRKAELFTAAQIPSVPNQHFHPIRRGLRGTLAGLLIGALVAAVLEIVAYLWEVEEKGHKQISD